MSGLLALSDPGQITRLYLDDPRPPHPDRPWVVMGMIESLDGGSAIEGVSSGLGGPPDRAVFRALRAVADVILVGAGTVRAEGYRAASVSPELGEWRRSQGKAPNPRIAIVSRGLDLDLTESLAASRPLVFTGSSAPPERRAEVEEYAEVVTAGEDGVEVARALEHLTRGGATVVTLEGGPSLNGVAFSEGVVDEVCVTLAPSVVSGRSGRIVSGPEGPVPARPERVILADDHVLLRYLI